jgi:hypothetical protein
VGVVEFKISFLKHDQFPFWDVSPIRPEPPRRGRRGRAETWRKGEGEEGEGGKEKGKGEGIGLEEEEEREGSEEMLQGDKVGKERCRE